MADNKQMKKARKRKDPQDAQPDQKDEPTKEEYAIAKWMRKNCPVKKTKFLNHTVEYFTANKAIDHLLDSPWAQPKKSGEDALFTTRESIVEYLDVMLRHKMFHRARKLIVPESELKSKKKKDKEEKEKESKLETKEKEEKVNKKEETVTAAESSQAEGDKTEIAVAKKKKDEGEKKKRKIRLDMHLDQQFVDGTDAYVWIYEPTPYYNYLFGFLVVVAVIAVCLFPLWPSSVRQGVYYLSLAAAGFLVFILALAVIRVVVFGIIWAITFGRHHLWLLPNLTEDVGFMASFWPLYKYEYKPGGSDEDEKDKKRKRDKSESNDENNEEQESQDKNEEEEGGPSSKPADQSETESEGSQPSQTGKDFEILDKEELDS